MFKQKLFPNWLGYSTPRTHLYRMFACYLFIKTVETSCISLLILEIRDMVISLCAFLEDFKFSLLNHAIRFLYQQ